MPRAVLNDTVLAESGHTVVVEGNHYFPPDAVNWELLAPSSTRTVCIWKGIAGYHHVVTAGATLPDAAWYYARPSPLARRIRDHVAFSPIVTIEPTERDRPRRRAVLGRFGRGARS
jgi:uncharacterized protein (DUF427 family)